VTSSRRGALLVAATLLGGAAAAHATDTAQARAQAEAKVKAEAEAEAEGFLKDLIRIDTQDPPGNESRVAQYLAAVLQRNGIAAELLEPVPGRASVVARLKGDGGKRALLIMGHEDVVPVERSHWSIDPFAAIDKDDSIWGRGASDDKASVAANLEVFLLLKRRKPVLKRDVIFLAEASEEASSPAGMATLTDKYWEKLDCEFALNEGGSSLVENGRIRYMGVATAEKLPRGMRLEAAGSSGHGSVPRVDNAVVHLAAAVAKVGNWQTPGRLNETTAEFFKRLATISPPDEARWYRNVLDPAVQDELRVKKPSYYSMLRTSVVPTMLNAGIKENVIPPNAQATLDVRALPDEDLDAFRGKLAGVIDDPAVQVIAGDGTYSMPQAPVSSLHTDMFVALEAAQKEVVPDAITLPVMTTGATDSSFLRAKGVAAYGIGVPKTDEQSRAVHGNDERIDKAQLAVFVRYLYRAVTQVAGRT
jgi:acetylornithine deacetylase/succinyl-diaminopimelate desuccinylase-like protein